MRHIQSALRRSFFILGFIIGILIFASGCSTLFGPDEEEDEDSIPIVGLGTLLVKSDSRWGGSCFLRGNGPAWSADCKEVFYCVEYFSEPMESYVRRVDIETKSNNDVAYFHGKRIYELSASPNGEYVIFIVSSGGYGEGDDELVYVVRSPLYNDAVVLDSKVGTFMCPWYSGFRPVWSSDSRWLAFQELDSTVSVYDMTIQQLAKSIHYNGVPLCFSLDGAELLIDPYTDTTYIQYDLGQDTYWDDTGIHLIYASADVLWGKLVGITRYSIQTGTSISLELPSIDLSDWWHYMGSSPDYSKVAMVFEDREVFSDRQHLYLGDYQSGEMKLIANSDHKDTHFAGVAFSPDGTRIAYLYQYTNDNPNIMADPNLYYQDL